MLLAVMSVLVFVLPLYQLGLGLRNLVNTVRAKATPSFRDIRQRLRGRSGAAIAAGPDLPEAGRREQARLHGRAGVSPSVCCLLRHHVTLGWSPIGLGCSGCTSLGRGQTRRLGGGPVPVSIGLRLA